MNPPPVASTVTVDASGYATIPGDANALPFKVIKETLGGTPMLRIYVLDGATPKVVTGADATQG
jgi:hypothetical protein